MLDDFTFNKNERGFSDKAFAFMRRTIIPTTKFLFKPRITNPENMPLTGPCFIYGNHANYFDPFMINVGMTQEPTAGVMTRDQFHKMLPRIFMDGIGIVPTSKYVPEPGSIRSVIKMIDQRRMIVIFPEGGRRWDGKPKPLIETTLKLFWKMRIPVHPVQIHGSYLSWPRWADNLRRGSVELRFLDPVHSSDFDDYETFANHCRELITFDEYHPPEEAIPVKCSKPAAGIQRFLYRCPDTGVNGAIFSPDGVSVFSRESEFRYRMNTASRLVDSEGEAVSIIDLFNKINEMPMVFSDSKDNILLEKSGSQVNKLDQEQRLQKLDRGYVKLTSNGLFVSVGSQKFELPFDQINYTSVEQNHKLTVTSPHDIIQINLEGQSALQWQLYIKRLKKGENPVTSL
ncbi:lysophospholipid acyltransferase family protein [Rhodohalobacter sp. 614A]|uniref:lysophospholipid acyltransferase family protein n=1 Tax=Rhodohalobacter sp. 614A TaxID=2908649 RepID=UPI001F1702DF|nr:lysophospholipid acyltransferase family protein [Rhodohalobacter sp. 614A]